MTKLWRSLSEDVCYVTLHQWHFITIIIIIIIKSGFAPFTVCVDVLLRQGPCSVPVSPVIWEDWKRLRCINGKRILFTDCFLLFIAEAASLKMFFPPCLSLPLSPSFKGGRSCLSNVHTHLASI